MHYTHTHTHTHTSGASKEEIEEKVSEVISKEILAKKFPTLIENMSPYIEGTHQDLSRKNQNKYTSGLMVIQH